MASSSTTLSTRTFISTLFATVQEQGFGASFRDALSDDVIWTATGSSPVSGVYRGKEAYLRDVLSVLHERLETQRILPRLHRMIVEEEWASVYFESSGVRAKNGADFSMEYLWLIRVVEREIVEVVGFYDQKKMHDIFE